MQGERGRKREGREGGRESIEHGGRREERGGRTGKEKGEKERWREFREEGGRAKKKGEWQGRRRKSIKGRAVQGRRAVIHRVGGDCILTITGPTLATMVITPT